VEADDLKELGYDQIAAHFSDKALEIEDTIPSLMEPLLYAAKAVLALKKLNGRRAFSIVHLERWRMSYPWVVYAKGRLGETVATLDSDVKDLKSDLQEEAFKSLGRRGIKISDEKVQGQIRTNKEFREKERQLSDLRAILSHVLDHCEQYKLIKDVLVQESTLMKRMTAH